MSDPLRNTLTQLAALGKIEEIVDEVGLDKWAFHKVILEEMQRLLSSVDVIRDGRPTEEYRHEDFDFDASASQKTVHTPYETMSRLIATTRKSPPSQSIDLRTGEAPRRDKTVVNVDTLTPSKKNKLL